MPVIDGKPLWFFTELMSVRDLRPWELDHAPVSAVSLYVAAMTAVADGKRRAEAEWEAGTTAAQVADREQAAAKRQAERAADFAADPEVRALLAAQAARPVASNGEATDMRDDGPAGDESTGDGDGR